MTPKYPEIVAVFEHPHGGHRTVARHRNGGLFVVFGVPLTTQLAKTYADSVQSGELKIVQSPTTPYHCWHICTCEQCVRVGGRFFDHSQESFNVHLRFVPNKCLHTFPNAKE